MHLVGFTIEEKKSFLGIWKIILGVGVPGLDFSIIIHVIQISLVELKVVQRVACSVQSCGS